MLTCLIVMDSVNEATSGGGLAAHASIAYRTNWLPSEHTGYLGGEPFELGNQDNN